MVRKLFLYLWYFHVSETKELRLEAQKSALAWCQKHHIHNFTDQYRLDFQAYMRAYINARCHNLAKEKLAVLSNTP